MDTVTHVATGVSPIALTTQDPAMASTFSATATTPIAGSLIPDGGTVLKLKNSATYISRHRGITHSIPFTILWPALITFLIFTLFSGTNPFHVWMWAQLTVFLRVFIGIFNSHDTQTLRPITNEWIQLSVINTFDPTIPTVLCIGIVLWIIGLHPSAIFFPIIALLIIYYTVRFKIRAIIKQQALKAIQQEHHPVKVFVTPTIKFMKWRVAIQTGAHDYIGKTYGRNVVFDDKVERQTLSTDSILWKVKGDKDIRTSLSFSSICRWQTTTLADGPTETCSIGLRYLRNDHYSLMAIAHVTNDSVIDHSYIDWVFTGDKLQRKLYAK